MTDEELTATPDTHDYLHDQNGVIVKELRYSIFYDPGKVSYWVEWEKVFYTIQHIYKVKLNNNQIIDKELIITPDIYDNLHNQNKMSYDERAKIIYDLD